MLQTEYDEILRKRALLGDSWAVLLEEIIDELIESGNGFDDLGLTTDKAFRLRDLLESEIGRKYTEVKR